LLELGEVGELHPWHFVDSCDDVSLVVDCRLLTEDSGELKVSLVEEVQSDADCHLSSLGEVARDEVLLESPQDGYRVEASAQDPGLGGFIVIGDSTSETVFSLKDNLSDLVVSGLREVAGEHVLKTLLAKAVKSLVLLKHEEVGKGEEIVGQSVEVMKSHCGLIGHLSIEGNSRLNFGAATEGKFTKGSRCEGGKKSENSCEFLHLKSFN
jgi:hypothetical protein